MKNFNETKRKSKYTHRKRTVFKMIRKNLATIGIDPQLARQSYPFSVKNIIGFIILGLFITFIFEFNLYETTTFYKRIQSTYACANITMMTLQLLILIFKVKKLFKFIYDCEGLINTSELKLRIYSC